MDQIVSTLYSLVAIVVLLNVLAFVIGVRRGQWWPVVFISVAAALAMFALAQTHNTNVWLSEMRTRFERLSKASVITVEHKIIATFPVVRFNLRDSSGSYAGNVIIKWSPDRYPLSIYASLLALGGPPVLWWIGYSVATRRNTAAVKSAVP